MTLGSLCQAGRNGWTKSSRLAGSGLSARWGKLAGLASCSVESTGPAPAVRALAQLSRALERSTGGLSLAHYRVLSAVAEGHERASRVAQRLALGKPAVSASVEALSSRGLLAKAGYAGDQRAVQLAVTPEGLEVLRRAEEAMVARLLELAARTGRSEEVLECLCLLGAALEDNAPAGPASGERAGI
jgi:DNA-binding MarR family transcriptional regulator